MTTSTAVWTISSVSFVENFVRMEKWMFDSPDLRGEVFHQFIKDCDLGNKLIKNIFATTAAMRSQGGAQ
jgi:poly(3-hydroxyalkanoate) synthetase